MTNVEALKACYVAIGGSAADVADAKTTAAVIEAISTIASGGGGGGDGILVVNVTLDLEEDAYLPDHTRAEVLSALQSGKTVFCSYAGYVSLFLQEAGYPEIYTNLLFTGEAMSPHTLELTYFYFEYAEDGTFTAQTTKASI